MPWFPFRTTNKSLGVDIGTSSIRIIELSREKKEVEKLENYGEIPTQAISTQPIEKIEQGEASLSPADIAEGIRLILEEAEIKTRRATFSIPDFSTFFTSFELPPMTQEEVVEAVNYEARQHVPLPLSEITLDWKIIRGVPGKNTKLKILLAAVPREIIERYEKIADFCSLELQSLEAEAFSLRRALITNEKEAICLIDIGARSTTVNIVNEGILELSYSLDFSGSQLTEILAKGFSIDYERAEQLKIEKGIKVDGVLLPFIDSILEEIEKIFQNFHQTEGKDIEKAILAGGTAYLKGLPEYFSERLKTKVEIANPFSKISYPSTLKKTLSEIGPRYAVAIGAAKRELEE